MLADGFAEAPGGDLLTADAIVERIRLAIVSEALRAVADGVAPEADIDAAMRLGARHPSGPFEYIASLGGREAVGSRLSALGLVPTTTARG